MTPDENQSGDLHGQLVEKITDLEEASYRLDEVMDILFDSLKEHGFQPTKHLVNRRQHLSNTIQSVKVVTNRLDQQLGRFEELVRISALLTSSLELSDVLEDVMDTVVSLTGAERAYLMLYDEDDQMMVKAARNWNQETINASEVGLSHSVVNAAIEDRRPILTTNAQADTRFMDQESIVMQKLRSIICIPLILGDKPVGVLYADNRLQKGVFSEEIIPILTAFGNQAAIAIANAQLHGKVQNDLKEAKLQIQELQISIDENKVQREVTQITDTPYFKELAEAAKKMRRRQRNQGEQ